MPETSARSEENAVSSQDALRDVLRLCEADRLARQLGLRSAAAANALRANEAALDHLAKRFAEGADGLSVDEAAHAARLLLGTSDQAKPALGGGGDA